MQAIWRVPLGEGKPWRASVEVYRILGIVGGQAGGAKDECALSKVQLRKIRVENHELGGILHKRLAQWQVAT
jgi:hypothetical protein